MSIALPATRHLQAWALEPRSGTLQPLLADALATRLVVTPDGQRIAYVGFEAGPPPSTSDPRGGVDQASVVWLVSATAWAPMVGWRAPLVPGERLVDVVRIERASEQEIRYLRAMAKLGAEPQTAAAVAAVLDRRSDQLGKVRTRLIEKGLLYAPTYGRAAFTVPQFDRFLRRSYPFP